MAQNLPLIKELISLEELPLTFFEINDSLDSVFKKIHYKNLFISKGKYNEVGAFSLTLVSFKKLGLVIPGTGGISLILNPGEIGINGSEIDLNLNYNWDILRFKNSFKNLTFDESVEQIFEIVLQITNLSKLEFLNNFINDFFGNSDGFEDFVQDFNIVNTNSLTLSTLSSENVTSELENIISQFENQNIDVFTTIFQTYLKKSSFEETLENLNNVLRSVVGEISLEKIKKILKLKAEFSINELSVALEFPRKYLRPIFTNYIDYPSAPLGLSEGMELPDNYFSLLKFDIGSISYSTDGGLQFNELGTFNFPKSYIGNTEFSISVEALEFDFDRESNISSANNAGYEYDFIGAYIKNATIGFPVSWGHNSPGSTASTAELYANNLLVGTGGISGTIGMRAINPSLPDPALLQLKFGQDFKVTLDEFSLTFQQNAIIESTINGTLQIPKFKNEDGSPAIIDINIHIGQDGEFSLVASAIPQIKKISVPNAFDFDIHSAFIGREQGSDGRFYIGVSGELDITAQGAIGNFLPDKIDIKKMLIYDDGTFEFEGGKLVLPKAYELKFGPATLSITGIHMGSHEQDRRKYKYFGFDGGVSTNPGGVDAQGKGLKFFYSVDDEPFDWFIRLESLTIDIILPSGTDPSKAAVIIHGFLSIAEPKIPVGATPELIEILKNSQEYSGGVSVRLPKFKGLEGSAAMRMNPKVPSFIVDLGIEMKQPILLGATGLGIYGFRALLGKNYVAEKTAANVPADGEWWQYYKAKIDPDYKEGIQVSKFNTKDGFSLGAGVSLATAQDAGKAFSSKLFFMLSLPDVFLFQGQAQFLKERIGLDANPDPPFYAIIAITKNSIEAGLGVNYKLRDNGKLVTVDGVVEMGFFWGNSSAWYINIGRETPEDRRIQARLFDILNMYFYLMLSQGGMRLGAGVKFELSKKFGPLSADLKAYVDTFGKLSRRPKQIGGAIKIGGKVSLKVCGFGFSVSGGATLAAEAPKPHIVTGEFEVCITVLKKERCAKFEFTWNFDDQLSLNHNPLLVGVQGEESNLIDTADGNKVAGMTHMVTQERFPVAYTSISHGANYTAIPNPNTWITNPSKDDYRVPLDSFLDIDFKKGMHVNNASSLNLGKLGGIASPANYVEFVPPIRGKSDRVRHEYYMDDIAISYWDELNSVWKPYDFYSAMLPFYNTGILNDPANQDALENMKWGYWQQQSPGLNNKLRILATTPLSYTANNADTFNIEDLGVNDGTIFCAPDPISETCVTFDPIDVTDVYTLGTLRNYEQILFRTVNQNGLVISETFQGLNQGLFISGGDTLEIYFPEPMYLSKLLVNTSSPQVTIEYFSRKTTGTDTSGLPVFSYVLMNTIVKNNNFDQEVLYTTSGDGIEMIKITAGTCQTNSIITDLVPNANEIMADLSTFIGILIERNHLTSTSVAIYPTFSNDFQTFFGSDIYEYVPRSGDSITLTQQQLSPISLSFVINDNLGYNCTYIIEPFTVPVGFGFNTITGVKSITPYTADDSLGANNNFLVDFDCNIGGSVVTARFILTTCHTISMGYSSCNASLYRLCYLSLADYLSNSSIPSQQSQIDSNNAMLNSINLNLQPIWRPNTTYAVSIKTTDKLYREGSSTTEASYQNQAVFGFKTAGPVGHFHKYPTANLPSPVVDLRDDFYALEQKGKADEFRLTNLKSYIDYTKSYPNADGDLSNAKPLFYENAAVNLFYIYNHVYHFFGNWEDVDNGSAENIANASLEINILNPAPSSIPETTISEGFVKNSLDHSSPVGTPPSLIHSSNGDVSILNNMLTNGNPCVSTQDLAPIDIASKKVMHLKPLKLYTAQFVAKYNPRIGSTLAANSYDSLVHSYVFQTSRYASFAKQVESYILKKDENNAVIKAAIFNIESGANLNNNLIQRVLRDQLIGSDEILREQYADRFDRLINGVFSLDVKTLQVPVTTEFNIIKNQGKVLGILIRNPEPFNNPRIERANPEISSNEIMETLKVAKKQGAIWGNIEDHYVIHSKDYSQMFVTERNFNFDLNLTNEMKFTFIYKVYNGQSYSNTEQEVIINFNTYLV